MRVMLPSRPEPRVATRHWVALSAAVVTIAAAPFVLPSYPLALLTLALAYGLFAFGLDLSWGRAGVVSIGHAAFFGIGAYGVAIAGHNDVPQIVGALAALIISALVALVVGRIGVGPKALASTMAVITLALTLLAEQGARSWLGLTNGSNGIFVPSSGAVTNFYVTGILVFVIVVAIWLLLLRGRFGRRALAVRLNEHRTEHLGVSPMRTKLTAFVLSALVATAAGAIAAPVMGLVSPGVLGIVMSTQVLVWVAVGGKGTIFGVFFGAGVVTIGQQYLGDAIGAWYLLVLGVVFILVVKFAPTGLVGILSRFLRRDVGRAASQGAVIGAKEAPDVPGHIAHKSADAIRITDVQKSFGSVPIINGVDLTVARGEIVCLIGPNGAGKTTLLNLIAGDLAVTSGRIEVLGGDVTRWAPHRRARLGLGRLFQVPSLYPDLTPGQNMAFARAEAFRAVDLPEELDRFSAMDDVLASDLSLADQRSLELAMAIAWGPEVVLLDEPAAGLSHEDSLQLASLMRRINAQLGCTLLVVEHDMDIVRELADRVVVLANGRVLTVGTMDEVAAHDDVRTAYLGAV
ncbi:amino acid/amide ABC transporter membrane protein 2 (HAAT family) /amino acid/amide ABC transporter ATP-binding protein 1 (HAAT family) [Homoserinimonas aerilata]|uniref:Amino acid/amide ABC transporter membrane protein 2 (HAAT family) /amino acid/amide ABC transporter ATP-binding protein 1 (HAAT family) n=2 Tax=Homoserinimonas aerilata TaxID=1162970 RepID=A0A542YFC1_9MICO|nr:amino acid/amide ABC transporter membrane protein 2 (HAAT family) /amino acid/amide ABC transporter ATP-binding protein 1 (HAAT family) [Homoserinimonas aerilata]